MSFAQYVLRSTFDRSQLRQRLQRMVGYCAAIEVMVDEGNLEGGRLVTGDLSKLVAEMFIDPPPACEIINRVRSRDELLFLRTLAALQVMLNLCLRVPTNVLAERIPFTYGILRRLVSMLVNDTAIDILEDMEVVTIAGNSVIFSRPKSASVNS